MFLHFALRLHFAPCVKPRVFVPPQLTTGLKLLLVFDKKSWENNKKGGRNKNQLPEGWNSRLSENPSALQAGNFLSIEKQITGKTKTKDLLKKSTIPHKGLKLD